MVEDLRRRLCNDGHEDQFPLFRLSARYWLSDETVVGVHKRMTLGEIRRFRPFDRHRPSIPMADESKHQVERTDGRSAFSKSSACGSANCYPPQNSKMAFCSAFSLGKPRAATAALKPPYCRASAATLWP
jgi:hypothetical protein